MCVENRFVATKKRDEFYNRFYDKWFVGTETYRIEDKEKKIPPIQFLTEDDMMTVYDLLKSKHMIFHNKIGGG